MDLVARAQRLPGPGETVTGSGFRMVPGGKSANQAVAAARLGAKVTFVGRVGSDLFAHEIIHSLSSSGVNLHHLVHDESEPTGVALIGVDDQTGENSIIVAPGANAKVSEADVERARSVIEGADMLLLSLEIPLASVVAALRIASAAGVRSILNPAPAIPLSPEILRLASLLTPNEHEVALLAGLGESSANPETAVARVLALGAQAVVVTLGASGALARTSDGSSCRAAPPPVAKVIDTTAAGDCFTAALGVALAEGRGLQHAMTFAVTAASVSVTRPGAQSSLPTRSEVDQQLAGPTGL
jgi:ribokinase